MTIDIIALAKEADCEIEIITGADDSDIDDYRFTEHELNNFATLLEAEIRKEFEDEARIQNDTIASQHTEIKALELAIDLLPSVVYVNALTAQNAKLMENIAKLQDALDKYGQHKKTCHSFIPLPTGWPHHYGCNCGLDELTFGNFDADLTPQPEKEGKE